MFHGLSADGQVKDISAVSPDPGEVNVFVLSRTGDGASDAPLLDKVNAALNAERVRPMTDNVTVLSASIINYSVTAVLTLYPGPASEVVLAAAQAALDAYTESMHRIGYDVTRSGIFAALHQPGVQNVALTLPAADIVVDDGQAAFCTGTALTIAGAPDV
ncbi:Baseplate J-like protein [compost metagenome]